MSVSSFRFLQTMQFFASLAVLALSWFIGSYFVGVLAAIGSGLAVWELLSPTPEERIQTKIESLQQQGIYPQCQPTEEDVRRLLQAGHKMLAVRLYLELNSVSLKQALEAVEKMA